MLAASRVASRFRAALPYGQWLVIAVQLGYAGYNLFQLYQSYRAQLERDANAGRSRTLSETMEYVVKARRKRQNNTQGSSSAIEEGENISNRENVRPTDSVEDSPNKQEISPVASASKQQAIDYSEPGPSSQEQAPEQANQEIVDDDIQIVHDSRLTASNKNNVDPKDPIVEENEDISDTLSNASTSLESTNSNRGIVEDIYRQCFICARSLDDPSKAVATLPFCMHPFHQQCLDGILKWHPKCPVCDFHIFSPI